MRTALYYIGLGLILVLFLNSSGPNLDTFIPGNPWEHYCKYELHKHPFHTNEKEYNYFLDTFTSTDKYEQIMIIYNNLYDTLIDELKGTISRFQAQYNIQEINPYLQDILQNPEDLVSLSQHHKR
jgi:hypothetical protein